jgi:protoporphyrinogen/coproporphyrinogen III oxidase
MHRPTPQADAEPSVGGTGRSDAAASRESVAVIGAGITGLTVAFRLRSRGVPVTLYEASGRVGGVIESIQHDGYLAEFGPNTVLETSPQIFSLIKDLGLESRRLYSDPAADKRYIVRGGRPVCLPTSPAGFLSTPLFSVGAKLRLLVEPFIRRAPPEAEESLAEFVLRRIGQEFLDYAINPFVAGVYAGDPARLSVRQAFPKLHALEQRYGSLIKGQILGARERKRRAEVSKQNAPKFSFLHGLQELVETLRERVADSLKARHTVVGLSRSDAAWQVRHRNSDGEQAAPHAAVVLCLPAYRIAQLHLDAPDAPSLAPLAEIEYPPVTSVVLGFRRQDVEHPLDGFGMLIPQIEGFRILGTLFSSSLFPRRAPEGHVTLTSYVGGTRAPELADRPEDELRRIVTRDLERILGLRGAPTFQHQVFYPRAIPQYNVGYGRFRALMDDAERRAPGLYFAGHYRDGISLGDSILSGDRVAERIAAVLRHPAQPPSPPLAP